MLKKEKHINQRILLSRQRIKNALDELEFSLSLLEHPQFEVTPVKISVRKKDNKFCGIVVKYKGVAGFIPKHRLNTPFNNLEEAQKLVNERRPIQVYLLRIENDKNPASPGEWQIPIFTMKEPF